MYTLAAKIVPTGVEVSHASNPAVACDFYRSVSDRLPVITQATLMSIISATNDLGGTAAKYLAAYLTAYFGIDTIAGSSCTHSRE